MKGRLAIGFRTQSGWFKWVIALCLLGSIGVTTKSVAQLAEQMFHARMWEVQTARDTLKLAEGKGTITTTGVDAAKNPVEAKRVELAAMNEQISNAQSNLAKVYGAVPNDDILKGAGLTRDGQVVHPALKG